MRSLQNVFMATAVLFALTASSAPAFALDYLKWVAVCNQSMGIRSAATPADFDGAGYAMDEGLMFLDCAAPPPPDWDTRLKHTIEFIKHFENSIERHLTIFKRCPGPAERYDGQTFRKCPIAGRDIIAATPYTMGNYTVDDLVAWVIDRIPEHQFR